MSDYPWPITPREALEQTILYGYLMNGRFPKPGAVVEAMSGRIREALKELKSADVANVRVR